MRVPHTKTLNDTLGPNRYTMHVGPNEQTVSGLQFNKVGEPRVVFPTLMSYTKSRAFQAGKPGSVYMDKDNDFNEPSAEEREIIMGYQPSSTAAPGITENERRSF